MFEFGEMVLPLFKSTKLILLPRIVSNPMCTSSSSNSSKTLPVGASVCVQSLPNPALGEYLSGYSLSSWVTKIPLSILKVLWSIFSSLARCHPVSQGQLGGRAPGAQSCSLGSSRLTACLWPSRNPKRLAGPWWKIRPWPFGNLECRALRGKPRQGWGQFSPAPKRGNWGPEQGRDHCKVSRGVVSRVKCGNLQRHLDVLTKLDVLSLQSLP